jgi:hypothetical protein
MGLADTSFDLADACDILADAITSSRNSPNWVETQDQAEKLNGIVSRLRTAADNARTAGAAASLEAATSPLADIDNAAAQAKAAVAKLAAANQMITLAGSLLSLAAAAAIGDPAGIAKSAGALISEVNALG